MLVSRLLMWRIWQALKLLGVQLGMRILLSAQGLLLGVRLEMNVLWRIFGVLQMMNGKR
jgi:hypothetical protein